MADSCSGIRLVRDLARLSGVRDVLISKSQVIRGHSSSMVAWETLYRKGDLSDITLIVGEHDEEFKAHRLVLAAQSDVMKTMLYGGMKESQLDVIKLPDVDTVPFKALLDFFYTGSVEVNTSFICPLIKLCDYYNVQKLKRLCCNWLAKQLCVEDVCQYLMFAADADEELYTNCFSWLEDHISQVMSTTGFIELLSAEQFEKILASDSLDTDEIDLFTALVKWVKYDDDTRLLHGISVAKQIRLPMMTPPQLLGKVQSSGLVEPAEIVKAITAVQQPDSTNPYEETSSAIVLRLPKKTHSTCLQWSTSLTAPLSNFVTFPRSNLAVVTAVRGTVVLNTECTLSIPSSIRVQVVSKSSGSCKSLQIGIEMNRNTPWSQNQKFKWIEVNRSLASSSADYKPCFSVAVGSVMYFSLHLGESSVSAQANGSAVTVTKHSVPFITKENRQYLSLYVVIDSPRHKMTVAIREDSNPSC